MSNLHVYRLDNDCIWRIIDQETVIISKDGKFLHRLNEVGTEIWKLADGSFTTDEIISHVLSEFDVSMQIARQDVLKFIEDLSQLGLLELSSTENQSGECKEC